MRLLEMEPLSSHTTFRIGGPARYYAIPETKEEVRQCIRSAKEKEIPYLIKGRGSNLLFSDEGYDGIVIEIGSGMEQIEYLGENHLRAEAGAPLSRIAAEAARQSLAGFEFAGGIPGALGGAVAMNAGAYGGEIKDVIETATVMKDDGEIVTLDKEQLELGYRTSAIQKRGYIVLEALFCFSKGDPEQIQARMRELNTRRREKQPLEYPSAGSTFKRPEGHFAGKLIEDSGMKGYRIGDAQVSEKHSGFIINRGNATASEVIRLMEEVQKKVYDQFGVRLEPEVKVIHS